MKGETTGRFQIKRGKQMADSLKHKIIKSISRERGKKK